MKKMWMVAIDGIPAFVCLDETLLEYMARQEGNETNTVLELNHLDVGKPGSAFCLDDSQIEELKAATQVVVS